jgi:hypothetical protein
LFKTHKAQEEEGGVPFLPFLRKTIAGVFGYALNVNDCGVPLGTLHILRDYL